MHNEWARFMVGLLMAVADIRCASCGRSSTCQRAFQEGTTTTESKTQNDPTPGKPATHAEASRQPRNQCRGRRFKVWQTPELKAKNGKLGRV